MHPDQPPIGLTERTINVVEAVVDAGTPVGPRGLARALGIDRSAVGRILKQLSEIEVLDRTADGYVPGPRLFAQARVLSAVDPLPGAVAPVLGALVDRFDETCYVCTFRWDTAVFTHEIQSSKPLRFVVQLGRTVPLHAGAGGRAILAGLPRARAEELLRSRPLPALTPNTVCDVGALLDLAAEDRRRGYSVSLEERVPGGAAIAAPFFDRHQRCLGSVVFTSPLARLDRERVDEIGAAVAAAARQLSQHLVKPASGGGRPTLPAP
jgi:IclR family acetate operon transcriptional repressor